MIDLNPPKKFILSVSNIVIIVFLCCCFTLPAQENKDKYVQVGDSLYTYRITTRNDSYGYDIFRKGKLLIRQPIVPGEPGNKGFVTPTAARIAAELVIKKLQHGEMPPTVSREELIKAGALKQ